MNDITIGSLIALTYWTISIAVFYKSVKSQSKEMWQAIKGADGVLDKKEIAVLYWTWLFPILVFIILLMAILNLEIQDKWIDMIKWVLGSLTFILTAVIVEINVKDSTNIGSGNSK